MSAGIAFVTVIAWIPGHAATYLGMRSQIPGVHTIIASLNPLLHALASNKTHLLMQDADTPERVGSGLTLGQHESSSTVREEDVHIS